MEYALRLTDEYYNELTKNEFNQWLLEYLTMDIEVRYEDYNKNFILNLLNYCSKKGYI